jgi:hypothetical protein
MGLPAGRTKIAVYAFSGFSGLELSKTAGKTFAAGNNFDETRKSPNIVETNAQAECPFYYYATDGSGNWQAGARRPDDR